MTHFPRLYALAATILVLQPLAASSQDSNSAEQAVREAGGQVLQLAQNDPRLDVAFHLSNVELTPDKLKALAGVKDRLAHLNLRGTNLNDGLAQHLTSLTELTRLHLEKTAITDAALAHLSSLQKLEYLNVYGTNVTDAGLEHVAKLPNLRKLYVWETKVTLDGVRKLREQLPELQIIGGPEEPKPKQPIEAQKPKKAE